MVVSEIRFYEKEFPDAEEVVMIKVEKVEEQGAYVQLLEYNNIEGMILSSELSRRRIRSVAKILRVGRSEPALVMRVDPDKGYIDLSKRRVTPEDAEQCEERFNKAKLVHQTMMSVGEAANRDLEGLYQAITWPLYRKYKHAYHAFRLMAKDADLDRVWEELRKEAPPELESYLQADVKEQVRKYIARKLQPQPVKIRTDVEMTCYEYDGVERIKDAMRAAMAAGTADVQVKMVYVAAPLYCITTEAIDKAEGLRVIQEAVVAATKSIEANNGRFTVRVEARVMSDAEERRLRERLEEEGSDDGDDDSEEEEFQESMGDVSIEKMQAGMGDD